VSNQLVLAGRWQDVLPGTYDPDHAIVITDPPFGLAGTKRRGQLLDMGYADTIPWSEHVAEVLDLLPAKRHVIRGQGSGFLGLNGEAPRRLCVEVSKYRARGRTPPHTVGHLWFGWGVWGWLWVGYRKDRPEDAWMVGNPYDDAERPANQGILRSNHRGITPYSAAWMAVSTWAERGPVWTVLDPYAGIGTIGRACADRGIRYVGAEVNPEWAREANERLGSVQQSADL